MQESPTLPTVLLFVPASRPDRFRKALDSGADAICIDLEDAVVSDEKAAARDNLCTYLNNNAPLRDRIWIRINAPETDYGQSDLRILASLGGFLQIIVPKAENSAQLDMVSKALAKGTRLMPLIESAAAFTHLDAIARGPNVTALMLGPADLAEDLQCKPTWDALLHARGMLVMAARRASIGVIDGPHFNLSDDEETERGSRMASELGFDGKAAIHPRQIISILRGFQPSKGEIDQARRIMDTFKGGSVGAALINGQFADRPLVCSALRTLSRAAKLQMFKE